MFSAGEIVGALLVSVATQRLGYTLLFVSGAIFQTIGFLIYGCSTAGWMAVVGRVLVGVNSGIIISLPFSYFGQSVTEYGWLKGFDTIRKERFKNQLIYVTGLIISFTFIPILGNQLSLFAVLIYQILYEYDVYRSSQNLVAKNFVICHYYKNLINHQLLVNFCFRN